MKGNIPEYLSFEFVSNPQESVVMCWVGRSMNSMTGLVLKRISGTNIQYQRDFLFNVK